MSTRAAIYLRQSLDRTGQELAVTRQRKACRQVAKDRGWTVVGEYADNSLSASKRTTRRPGYEQLVTDYHAGRFDAVVVWDLDRLTRQPRQIEDWIDAAEERGLLLTTVDGQADLSTDNGRLFARIKASVARSEVERKSARQKAGNQQRAEQGRPHPGRRVFGYTRDGMTVNEAEAVEFRRAVEQVKAGVSLRAVVKDWNARGVTTTAGNPWGPTELRRLLGNPRHAGILVHRGAVMGRGSWPAIIDEDDHLAVTAVLSDPARRPRGRPRVYLLSGVARCGACPPDAPGRLYGRVEARGALYVCERAAHLGRKIEPVDDYVQRVIVGRLSMPDAAAVFATPDTSAQLKELRGQERSLRAKLDGLAAAFADGAIDGTQLRTGSARLRARLEAVQQAMPALVGTPVLAPLAAADDVAAAWEALPVESRREVIGVLAEVTVLPAGRGARVFDPDTVRIRWR